MKSYRITIAIVAFLCMHACGYKNAPLTSTMHTEGLHHKWKVTLADGITDVDALYIDLRSVYKSGAAGKCHYFSFTPKFGHHSSIKIDNITTHLASCTDKAADDHLLAGLKKVYTFSLAADQLTLYDIKGAVLFKARKAADDEKSSIARKWWIKTMINADNEQLTIKKAFLDFTNTGQGAAFVGCNQFSFPVNADDTFLIHFGAAAGTEKFCTGAMQNDDVFKKVLPLVAKYQVIGNRLKLFDKDNELLLEATSQL
ncbi:META domain-containing protein [Niabella insulamsoli]|uniref:META domain-containing protein n=1 Tax=Niabella insulamsoli TaxID=3144874 RepID=UPI0031FE071D